MCSPSPWPSSVSCSMLTAPLCVTVCLSRLFIVYTHHPTHFVSPSPFLIHSYPFILALSFSSSTSLHLLSLVIAFVLSNKPLSLLYVSHRQARCARASLLKCANLGVVTAPEMHFSIIKLVSLLKRSCFFSLQFPSSWCHSQTDRQTQPTASNSNHGKVVCLQYILISVGRKFTFYLR